MQAVVVTVCGPVLLVTWLKFRSIQKEQGSKDDSIYPVVQGMALSIFCIFQEISGE